MIGYIDLGISNLGSLLQAFAALGQPLVPIGGPDGLRQVSAIVVPGVGAFGDGMAALRGRGLVDPLRRAAADGTPIFGICLGMQLLAESSEEFGRHEGLGLIRGHVRKLVSDDPACRVPNIGWCDVAPTGRSVLFPDSAPRICYHVHSYHLDDADPAAVAATIRFGGRDVPVAVEQGSVFGVQFHPEKSQDDGLAVLNAFAQHLRRLGRLEGGPPE